MISLKFILDVGVGHRVFHFLNELGYDVISVSNLHHSMTDVEILAIAERDRRMVVTMDKDFGELVFKTKSRHNGVLLLRLEDAKGPEKVEIMRFILENFASEMEGRFCIFQNGRLRIRP